MSTNLPEFDETEERVKGNIQNVKLYITGITLYDSFEFYAGNFNKILRNLPDKYTDMYWDSKKWDSSDDEMAEKLEDVTVEYIKSIGINVSEDI
jgi:hypothetical protein